MVSHVRSSVNLPPRGLEDYVMHYLPNLLLMLGSGGNRVPVYAREDIEEYAKPRMPANLTTASSSANPASPFPTLWAHVHPAIDHIMTSTAQGDKTPGVDYTLYANIHSFLYN